MRRNCCFFLFLLLSSLRITLATDIPAEEPTAACDINHLDEHLNVHRASPGLKLSGRAHEINERFVSVLGPFLRSTETLSKLMFSRAHETLGYFSIPDHGKGIFESLQQNKSVQVFSIDAGLGYVHGADVYNLTSLVRKNSTLQELTIGVGEELTHFLITELASAIQRNKTLKKIDLSFYEICRDYADEFVAIIKQNKTLTSITLRYTGGLMPKNRDSKVSKILEEANR